MLIDCSRDLGQPFELLIGKKFKLEVWEELIKTMRVKEVARFMCHKSVRSPYKSFIINSGHNMHHSIPAVSLPPSIKNYGAFDDLAELGPLF